MPSRKRGLERTGKGGGPFRFEVLPDHSGERLDQAVAQIPGISRTRARQIIDLGGVHVNGRRVRRCSYQVKAGDGVEIFLDDSSSDPFRLGDKDVLFRDRYVIAVSKPAGVETQPTPARFKGTLYEALLVFLQNPFRPLDQPEIGMVQRLDRETSGVLVFSIHPRAHAPLTRALSDREVGKSYLALVAGHPAESEGEIRSHLARTRRGNRVLTVSHGGKEAITRFRLLKFFGDSSLLEVEILTGRSHQIRAHLSEAGTPLLGDLRYGGPSMIRGRTVPRQMLHSHKLQIMHPVTGEPLLFEAPPPDDFASLLAFLRDPVLPVAPDEGV